MKKYFPKLLGNDESKSRLGNSIENETVPHAFLIGGPSGSGKTTLAYEIAAALNCEEKNAPTLPCGNCNRCRRIYDGNFPDLKILSKESSKATLGVEAVKQFREDMFLSPTESNTKIYIIDDAESMTVEAQNSLLKVLEEPPENVIILLLTKESDRILTTIKSRTQYIAMTRFDEDELRNLLINRSLEARIMARDDAKRFEGIIMSAGGQLGVAERLIDKRLSEENEQNRQDVLAFINAIGQRTSYADIYSAVMSLPTKRTELLWALERLISALRDLILLKFDKNARMIFYTSREDATTISKEISSRRLLAVFDSINHAHELCNMNANVQNILSSLSSNLLKSVTH